MGIVIIFSQYFFDHFGRKKTRGFRFFFGGGNGLSPVAPDPRGSQQENNFQGGVHIVPKDKVKEVAEKMLGKTPLGVKVIGFCIA